MSLQVRIVVFSINTAGLFVTLICPGSITPLVLITTIASSVAWTFSKQENPLYNRKWQWGYTGIASALICLCIILGVTTTISRAENPLYPGQFIFTFDETVVFLANRSLDYLFFAIPVFAWVVLLMSAELVVSYREEKLQDTSTPIAQSIKRKLAK